MINLIILNNKLDNGEWFIEQQMKIAIKNDNGHYVIQCA